MLNTYVTDRPFHTRALSLVLSCIMLITGWITPEFASLLTFAAEEVPINSDDSYDVQLHWRDDQNKKINSEDSAVYYVREDSADKKRFIYLGIYVNNKTTAPIQPGEFELTFTGLDGLNREIRDGQSFDSVYGFKEDDSVFTRNWTVKSHTTEVVNGVPVDTYTIVNTTPLSNERISTLFWEIPTRTAVSTENGDNINDQSGKVEQPFHREINATYKITRIHDENGNILDGNGDIVSDVSEFVMTSYADANGNTYLLVDGSGCISKTNGTKYKDGYQVNGDKLLDAEGHEVTKNDADGKYYYDDNGTLTSATPISGIPVIYFDGTKQTTNNDTLDFNYSTIRDEIIIDVTAKPMQQTGADDLHDSYDWCLYTTNAHQYYKARGLQGYSYYIDVEVPTEYSGYYSGEEDTLRLNLYANSVETNGYTFVVNDVNGKLVTTYYNSKNEVVNESEVLGRYVKKKDADEYYKVENSGSRTLISLGATKSGDQSISLNPEDIILIGSEKGTITGENREWHDADETHPNPYIRITYPEYTNKMENLNDIDFDFNVGVDKMKIAVDKLVEFKVTGYAEPLYNDETKSIKVLDFDTHTIRGQKEPEYQPGSGTRMRHEKHSSYEGGDPEYYPPYDNLEKRDKYFHGYPVSITREFLSGNLFYNQTLSYDLDVLIDQVGTGSRYYKSNNADASNYAISNNNFYNLVLVDDALGVYYSNDTVDENNRIVTANNLKAFPLVGGTEKDYQILNVTIPKGIYHNAGGEYKTARAREIAKSQGQVGDDYKYYVTTYYTIFANGVNTKYELKEYKDSSNNIYQTNQITYNISEGKYYYYDTEVVPVYKDSSNNTYLTEQLTYNSETGLYYTSGENPVVVTLSHYQSVSDSTKTYQISEITYDNGKYYHKIAVTPVYKDVSENEYPGDGIVHYEYPGYPYEVFYQKYDESDWTSCSTGITSQNESIQVALPDGTAKVKIEVYEVNRTMNFTQDSGKPFKMDVKFTLNPEDERFSDLISGSDKLSENHIRIVNYSYMQALFERNNVTYDLAAYDNAQIDKINQDYGAGSYDNHGLPTWVNNIAGTGLAGTITDANSAAEVPSGLIPYRAHSNIYLRSAVTKLVSRTNVIKDLEFSVTHDTGQDKWYGTDKDSKNPVVEHPFGNLAERYASDDTYFGILETYATLKSENPVTLKEFVVVAELPEFVQLPKDENGQVDLEQIFNTIKFESEYFTGDKNNTKKVSETNLKLGENVSITVEETPASYDEQGNRIPPNTRIIVKFDFSVGAALLADSLTKVSFQYPVVVFAENDELEKTTTLKPKSYTLLTDKGKTTAIQEGYNNGNEAYDIEDIDKNKVSSEQMIAESSNALHLNASNIDIQTGNHKHVKTAFSTGGYTRDSYVHGYVQDSDNPDAVNDGALYTYRLRFIMNTMSKEDLNYAYIYDEIERFSDNDYTDTTDDTAHSQWQGVVLSVDVKDIIQQRIQHGIYSQPVVYYIDKSDVVDSNNNVMSTSENYLLKQTTDGSITGIAPSAVHDFITNPDNKWKRMNYVESDQISGLYYTWKPQSGDEPYAICVELIAKGITNGTPLCGNSELKDIPLNYSGVFETDVFVNMRAPVANASNIQKKARNRSVSIFDISALPDKSKPAEITSVRLANNLKIMKVDYTSVNKTLYGAKFSTFVLKNESVDELEYAQRNSTQVTANGRTEYYKEDMKNMATNASGILELPLATGEYYIWETEVPNHYVENTTLYHINFTASGQAEDKGAYELMDDTDTAIPDLTFTEEGTTYKFKVVSDDKYKDMIEIDSNNNGLISIKNKMDAKATAYFTKVDAQHADWLVDGATYQLLKYAEDDDPIPVSVYRNTETFGGKNYYYYECTNSEGSIPVDGITSGEGVYHQFKKDENNTITGITSEIKNGLLVIRNLEPGVYVLREIKAPNGYQLSANDFTFMVSFDNMVKYIDKSVVPSVEYTIVELESEDSVLEDDEQPCSITMQKIDVTNNNNKIQGARYALYQLQERPQNSELSETEWKQAAANIRKRWSTASEEDKALYWGNPVKTSASNSGGYVTFNNVQFGTYMILETRAASGYKINYGYIYENNNGAEVLKCAYTSTEGCVDEDGLITINADIAHAHLKTDITLQHKEEEKTGSLRINKYNLQSDGTRHSLPNAVFVLYKQLGSTPDISTDTKIDEYVTLSTSDTWNGWTQLIPELQWGNYYVIEKTAPSGYEKAEGIVYQFEVNRFTADDGNYPEIKNEQKKGTVTLSKRDKEGTKDTDGKYPMLEKEAVFELLYVSTNANISDKNVYVKLESAGGSTAPNIYTIISEDEYNNMSEAEKTAAKAGKEVSTSGSGKLTVQGLEWGSYYFKETRPPVGYANAEDIAFKINRQSCEIEQQLDCLEPKATAYINIDKYIDTANYADYIDAYGNPTFIFRITEISSMPTETNPNPAPKPNGNTYLRTVTFNGSDTHMFESISVGAGYYMIEELNNPRYEFVSCKTVKYAASGTDTDLIKYLNDAFEQNYCTNINGYSTSNVIAYCNLLEDTSPNMATYRVEYHNKIKRYDQLSHADSQPNHFSAAERYITGLSVVYPEIIPVYSDTDTFELDKTALEARLLYNKADPVTDPENEGTILTANQLKNLKLEILSTDKYGIISDSVGNQKVIIPADTGNCSGQSHEVKVTFIYEDIEYETKLTLNYSTVKTDLIKRVTLRQDVNFPSMAYDIPDAVDKKQSVTLVFKQSAHAETYDSEHIEVSNIDEDLAAPDTESYPKAGYAIDVSGYRLKNWQYEKPDGSIVNLDGTSGNPRVVTLKQLQDYIFNDENYNLTNFKFSAVLEEIPITAELEANESSTFASNGRVKLNITNGNITAVKRGNAKGYKNASSKVEYSKTGTYSDRIRFYLDNNVIYWYTVDSEGLPTEGDVYVSGSCSQMFEKWSKLADVSSISNWNFGEVSNMYQMFNGCSNLTNVTFSRPISMKNSSTYFFNRTFQNCSKLESVTMAIDTSDVKSANYAQCKEMFKSCSKLTTVNLSGNFTKIYNVHGMFNGCTLLTAAEFIRMFGTWTMRTDISSLEGGATGNGAKLFDNFNNAPSLTTQFEDAVGNKFQRNSSSNTYIAYVSN